MTRSLTEDHRRQFDRDGLVFPFRVLTPAEAGHYRAACDDLEVRLGGKPRTIEVRQMHLHFRWAFELATQPSILDVIEELLGPNLLIWATELFAKHPHDAAVSIGWHRDRPYMGFAGAGHTATAWVALSDSMVANGCMCGVPLSLEKPLPPGQPAGKLQPHPANEPDIVNVELHAGEMSLHNPDILHGSSPNRSAQKRVGFVIRYVTPAAQPLHGRPALVLARGRASDERFDLAGPPSDADAEEALAAMKQSATEHLDAVLQNLKHAKR